MISDARLMLITDEKPDLERATSLLKNSPSDATLPLAREVGTKCRVGGVLHCKRVYGIGGILPSHVPQLLKTGFYGIAVRS